MLEIEKINRQVKENKQKINNLIETNSQKTNYKTLKS